MIDGGKKRESDSVAAELSPPGPTPDAICLRPDHVFVSFTSAKYEPLEVDIVQSFHSMQGRDSPQCLVHCIGVQRKNNEVGRRHMTFNVGTHTG